MRNSTVLTLLAVALVLLGFILFFEKDIMSTSERSSRSEHVFSNLRIDFAHKIELKNSQGEKIVLKRDPKSVDATLAWQIVSPQSYRADITEINAILFSMDFLIARRKVEDNWKNQQYGLDKPKVEGKIFFGNRKISFKVGSEDLLGENVYVSNSDEPKKIFIVSKDFLKEIDKELFDLRSKKITEKMPMEISEITILAKDEASIFISKDFEKNRWKTNWNDLEVRASDQEIRLLLGNIRDLNVASFVPKEKQASAQKAMSPALFKIKISGKDESMDIQIGAPCKQGHYIKLGKQEEIFCIGNDFVKLFNRSAKTYVERKIVPMHSAMLDQIEIKAADKKLSFSKKDNLWMIEDKVHNLDQVAISKLADLATSAESQSIMPLNDTNNKYFKKIVFSSQNNQITVKLFKVDGQLLAQRDEEPIYLQITREFAESFIPEELYYRIKTIQIKDSHNLQKIQISGAVDQTVEKKEGTWQLSEPIEANTDLAAVNKVVEFLSQIAIEEYVVERKYKNSFNNIYLKIVATYTKQNIQEEKKDQTTGEEIILEIGDHAPNKGRFARVSSEPELVFVISEENVQVLKLLLISRDLIKINSDIINRAEIIFDDDKAEMLLTDGLWISDGCPASETGFSRLLIELGQLRPIKSYSYGNSIKKEILKINLYSDLSQEPATLIFGEQIDNEARGTLVKRSDIEATFVVHSRLAHDLMALCK